MRLQSKTLGHRDPSYWTGSNAYLPVSWFSKIKREDVVVFNVPPLSQNDGIEYPFDLKTFYVKRCVALAGDRLEIRNKQVFANGLPLANPEI